jgi:hypothetical protein
MEDEIEVLTDEVAGIASGAETAAVPAEIRMPLVTLADFSAVDIEAPIATLRSVDCASFADPYRKAAEVAAAEKNEIAVRVYRLLAAVTQMHFKPGDRGEP